MVAQAVLAAGADEAQDDDGEEDDENDDDDDDNDDEGEGKGVAEPSAAEKLQRAADQSLKRALGALSLAVQVAAPPQRRPHHRFLHHHFHTTASTATTPSRLHLHRQVVAPAIENVRDQIKAKYADLGEEKKKDVLEAVKELATTSGAAWRSLTPAARQIKLKAIVEPLLAVALKDLARVASETLLLQLKALPDLIEDQLTKDASATGGGGGGGDGGAATDEGVGGEDGGDGGGAGGEDGGGDPLVDGEKDVAGATEQLRGAPPPPPHDHAALALRGAEHLSACGVRRRPDRRAVRERLYGAQSLDHRRGGEGGDEGGGAARGSRGAGASASPRPCDAHIVTGEDRAFGGR